MGEEVIDALKNINISVNKGEYVAFMGPSGSGKSTLVQLIPRLFDVTGGEILINGMPIKNFKKEDLVH